MAVALATDAAKNATSVKNILAPNKACPKMTTVDKPTRNLNSAGKPIRLLSSLFFKGYHHRHKNYFELI